MKRAAIITIAGKATRFNESLQQKAHKAIYFEENPKNTLLYHQLTQCRDFEKIVVVTGYMQKEVEDYIQVYCREFLQQLVLVWNEHYSDYGSGYSLYLGITACREFSFEEIVFLEGDLYFDDAAFEAVCNSPKNVLTVNHDLIQAQKAVVLYMDGNNRPKYLFSVSHGILEMRDSFCGIYNSGQVWKFTDTKLLYEVIQGLRDSEQRDTNLVIIQKYFDRKKEEEYELIDFQTWMNCNLVSDYRKMFLLE